MMGTGTIEEERVYHRYVRMGDWYRRGGKGVSEICMGNLYHKIKAL